MIGQIYGGRLALSGHEVTLLARGHTAEEHVRIAVERAAAEKAVAESQASRELVEGNLHRALALLDNAHGQYVSASSLVRRLMNQAIFARMWLVEDEIVGADCTLVYRRLLADNLAAEIAAEEASEQAERSRTNDLSITTVEDREKNRRKRQT